MALRIRRQQFRTDRRVRDLFQYSGSLRPRQVVRKPVYQKLHQGFGHAAVNTIHGHMVPL
jgi:hypothetical protein